jgi:hypothetical protein
MPRTRRLDHDADVVIARRFASRCEHARSVRASSAAHRLRRDHTKEVHLVSRDVGDAGRLVGVVAARLELVAILVVIGCGRVGFDSPSDTGRPPCQATATPVFVRGTCAEDTGGATSIAATLDVTAQNTLVVVADFDSTVASPTIFDSRGNSFRAVSAAPARSVRQSAWIWYATIESSGSDSITVMLGPITASITIYLHEYAGLAVDPFGGFVTDSGTGTELATPRVVTTDPNEVLLAHGCIFSSLVTGGDGAFQERERCNGNMTQDRIASVPGLYGTTFDASDTNTWLASLVALRPACL